MQRHSVKGKRLPVPPLSGLPSPSTREPPHMSADRMDRHHRPSTSSPPIRHARMQSRERAGDPVRAACRIQLGQTRHPARLVHELTMRPRIAQQVRNLVGPLADQTLRIDREPAACAVQNIVVMQIAMQHRVVTLCCQQAPRDIRAPREDRQLRLSREERSEPIAQRGQPAWQQDSRGACSRWTQSARISTA